MLLSHINEAIKKVCPLQRHTCSLAYLGACAPVNGWRINHKGFKHSVVQISPLTEAMKNKMLEGSRRGGKSTAEQRRWNKVGY